MWILITWPSKRHKGREKINRNYIKQRKQGTICFGLVILPTPSLNFLMKHKIRRRIKYTLGYPPCGSDHPSELSSSIKQCLHSELTYLGKPHQKSLGPTVHGLTTSSPLKAIEQNMMSKLVSAEGSLPIRLQTSWYDWTSWLEIRSFWMFVPAHFGNPLVLMLFQASSTPR